MQVGLPSSQAEQSKCSARDKELSIFVELLGQHRALGTYKFRSTGYISSRFLDLCQA